MTGTAVNPLLRAAHLALAGKRVSLVVPWLHPHEQALVFSGGLTFEKPSAQEAHIRQWLREQAGLAADIDICFYPGRYDMERGSILPLGDITRFINPQWCDLCILEEPEHLTWYHNGPNWRHRFRLVVGVVHTNYIYYAETWEKGGKGTARVVGQINEWVCRAYCDSIIKLSDTLQPLPRAVVCNVHGVRADFIRVGSTTAAPGHTFSKGAYFLGKVLWAKGHRHLLDYLQLERDQGRPATHVDVFGSGEDINEVKSEAERRQLDITFFPATDHAGPSLHAYKVFVNPSQSEVLSTTTAEALAMGKFVVIQRHPSNDFFLSFANTLPFTTPEEFLAQLHHALNGTPKPLSEEERHRLSWEGATARFLSAISNLTRSETLPSLEDHVTRWVHSGIQKGGVLGDAVRVVSGAGPIAKQSWLQKQRFRDAAVTEIVEQSLLKTPLEELQAKAS